MVQRNAVLSIFRHGEPFDWDRGSELAVIHLIRDFEENHFPIPGPISERDSGGGCNGRSSELGPSKPR